MAKINSNKLTTVVDDDKLAPCHKMFANDPDDLDYSLKPPAPKRKSLYDMVDYRLQLYSRGKVVRDLCPIFDVKPFTIDRAIAEVHKDWKEFANQTRAQRMQRYVKRKETLFEMAMKKGDEKSSNTILETFAETMGDKKPDIHVLLGGDKTPQQLLAQSDELRKLTEDLEDGEDG